MASNPSPRPRPLYRGNLLVLGILSLLTDVSSEMIVPYLPLFLTATLGAQAMTLGLIEGVADATAALLKGISGWMADRSRRLKPLVLAGYSLSSIARPLVGIAPGWATVLLLRFTDRFGKGVRTSPRDALLAGSVPPERRGAAFGFHRAMDHTGAMIGPLLGAGLMLLLHDVRQVFLWAAVPAVLSVLVILFFLKEPDEPRKAPTEQGPAVPISALPRRCLVAIGIFAVLGLSQASDAFLLLKASESGMAAWTLPLLWAGFHLLKALASHFGGDLSDRVSRKKLLVVAYVVYAAAYGLFAVARTPVAVCLVFALYAVYFGSEGIEKALVSRLAPAELRGRAFGLFNMTTGLALLPASLLFGAVWTKISPEAAFRSWALLALAGAVLLMLVRLEPDPTTEGN